MNGFLAGRISKPLPVIIALGVTQTIGWASSYYLPAILAVPIGRDLGFPPTWVFGALSGALVIAGLMGPRVGHFIDTVGGRGVLAISNLLFAAGLLLLSWASGLPAFVASWSLIGLAMGTGVYEAAFAALTRIYGAAARKPITGITLIAGFASTVGWPLTSWLEAEFGWRAACQVWAALHLVLSLPLHLLLPTVDPLPHEHAQASQGTMPAGHSEMRAMVVLAYMFAATGFVSSGLSALMPAMLVQLGATPAAALFASTVVGPAQVVARFLEAGFFARYHPLFSARIATLLTPVGAGLLIGGGPLLAPVFAAFYGAGTGIVTIARGTLPLVLFGPRGFGRRVGLITLPSRATGALSPLALGLMLDHWGIGTLWICAFISLTAFGSLLLLPQRTDDKAHHRGG